MPVVIKKTKPIVSNAEFAAGEAVHKKLKLHHTPADDVPFDGGTVVADKGDNPLVGYGKAEFKDDLKRIRDLQVRRELNVTEMKKLLEKQKQIDTDLEPHEARAIAYIVEQNQLKDYDEHKSNANNMFVEVSKMSKVRTVTDIPKVRELMGDEDFMKIVNVQLGKLDDYLTLPQRKLVISEAAKEGSRKITVKAVGGGTVVPEKHKDD